MTWRGAEDMVNDAIIYAFTPTDSTGTGYWHSFLRVSSNLTNVKGWNNDYKKEVEFQEDFSWTSSFLLRDVPQVMVDDTLYREFQLDINQNKSGTDALISIDELEVYVIDLPIDPGSGEPVLDDDTVPLVTYPFEDEIDAGKMKFVWALDGPGNPPSGTDNVILLNFHLNPGSGKRDFKIQIPDDLFDTDYNCVVLYTEHGGDAYTGYYDLDADPTTTDDIVSVTDQVYPNNDGFEEWGVTKYPATKLGHKFNDLDADGIWDIGEEGLAGWTIYVDYDGDGILDAGEPSAVTGADGAYRITGIEPGTYDVREVQQSPWICSCPASGYYADEVFGNGAYVMGNDFGNYLPNAEIDVTKIGDELSKVGDSVTYTITIENTGDMALEHITVDDTLLGDLSASFADTLAPGASESHDFPYVVQAGDPDPLPNTVTVHSDPAGALATDVTDSDTWTTNLFQPSINIVKTGDALSKIGDTVHYTITVYNDSSADTPEMAFDITDAKLGINEQDVVIANGGTYVIGKDFVIPEGASDPYVNTVNVHATVAGFPNTYDDSDSWSTNLFQPAINVVKEGDILSKIGDKVSYKITVYNNSSADTPEMYFDIVDAKLGIDEQDVVIANGEDYVIEKDFVIPAGADDPYVNTVNVHATVADFPNTYDDSDSWSTNLFQPGITLTKVGDKTIAMPGEWVHYTVTVTNTSSSDAPALIGSVNDTLGGYLGAVNFLSGDTVVFEYDYQMPFEPSTMTIHNVATVTASPEGFPNVVQASDDWDVRVYWYGFTPGYWKMAPKTHPGSWERTGYTTTMLVSDIFCIPSSLMNGKLDLNKDGKANTLLDALGYKGGNDLKGKAQILLRAAVAALLNEASLGDYYLPYDSVADLVNAVNSTLSTNDKAAYTELAGILDKWNNGIHEFPV